MAVILGLAAAFTGIHIIKKYTYTETVFVATRDIEAYQRITADDIKATEMPKIAIPKDAVKDPKEIIGKHNMWPIASGDIIRKNKIADTKINSLISAKLSSLKDPTLRAFALPYTKETGVGGEINEGDRIDIIASVKIETSGGLVGVGKTIARNVLVLKTEKPAEDGKGIIIVALTPQQIEDIAFALTSGTLRYSLNGYETDINAANTQGVTGADWLEKYGFILPGQVKDQNLMERKGGER
ncbi:MAG: Flp pilus assembly protein CpaB [Caldanaerobacter sp.]